MEACIDGWASLILRPPPVKTGGAWQSDIKCMFVQVSFHSYAKSAWMENNEYLNGK